MYFYYQKLQSVARLPPHKGPESGGTTLINAYTFSFLTVIAGATLYFVLRLSYRAPRQVPNIPLKNLSAPYQLTGDSLSGRFLSVLVLFFAVFLYSFPFRYRGLVP